MNPIEKMYMNMLEILENGYILDVISLDQISDSFFSFYSRFRPPLLEIVGSLYFSLL